MASRVVITLADLEVAVPLDRALEAAGTGCTLASGSDETRSALRRDLPDVLVLTGAVHEPAAAVLMEWARDHEIAVLALL
ncbi:MAG: hypothetical protein CVV20_01315, partial [Gemmatimonadetes bacterium HGW-Gemmatimonadetes-1]